MGASSPSRVSISNCEVTEAYAAMDDRRTIKSHGHIRRLQGCITIAHVDAVRRLA